MSNLKENSNYKYHTHYKNVMSVYLMKKEKDCIHYTHKYFWKFKLLNKWTKVHLFEGAWLLLAWWYWSLTLEEQNIASYSLGKKINYF